MWSGVQDVLGGDFRKELCQQASHSSSSAVQHIKVLHRQLFTFRTNQYHNLFSVKQGTGAPVLKGQNNTSLKRFIFYCFFFLSFTPVKLFVTLFYEDALLLSFLLLYLAIGSFTLRSDSFYFYLLLLYYSFTFVAC